MNNILLIYADIRSGSSEHGKGEFSFGVSILSAVLKASGYSVSLLHITRDLSWDEFANIQQFDKADLIGISYLTFSKDVVAKWPAWIKKLKNIPVIAGGIHPTLAPEDAISVHGMDMIITGEADKSLPMLLDAFKGRISFDDVPGLWRKSGDELIKNDIKKVVQDLDELPYLDTDVFQFDRLLSSNGRLPHLPYMTSRGCPFNCSYCSNSYLRSFHPRAASYVRRHSVDRVISEVSCLLDKYPFLKTVSFVDDMFNMDDRWLEEFSEKYRLEIGLPFRILVRIDAVTEYQARVLKNAGCFRATFGIESGDPNIRYQVLNRKISDKAIQRGIRILKRAGIQTVSYNMVGLPDETNHSMLATIKINARHNPNVAFCSIFQPHQQTRLYELCKARGYLTRRHYRSVYEGSTIKLPGLSETDIMFMHRFFRFLILMYKIVWKCPGKSAAETMIDRIVGIPAGLKKALIKLHDRWVGGLIIDRQYQRLERGLVAGPDWSQKRMAIKSSECAR